MPTTKPIISLDDLRVLTPIPESVVTFDARLLNFINVATFQIENATQRLFTRQAHTEFFASRSTSRRHLNLTGGGVGGVLDTDYHSMGTTRVITEHTLYLAAPNVDLSEPITIHYDPLRDYTSLDVVQAVNYDVDADNARIFMSVATLRGLNRIKVQYTGGFSVPASDVTPTTFDSTNKDASITLSSADLTAAGTGGGVGSAFTISRQLAGKYVAEFTIDAATSSPADLSVGVAKVGAGTGVAIGEDASSYGYRGTGLARTGAATVAGVTLATFAAGDIIGVIFDVDIGAVWFSKNGVLQNGATLTEIEKGDVTNAAFTGLSGTFMMGVGDPSGTDSLTVTANFGATSFTGTTPTGFSSGFGEPDARNQNLSTTAPEDLKMACAIQAVYLFKKLDVENVGSAVDKKQGGPNLNFLKAAGLTPEAASLVIKFKRLLRGSA